MKKLIPDQPGFSNFERYTKVWDKSGIFTKTPLLFYEIRIGSRDLFSIPIIPDGCMDIIFIIHRNSVESWVIGTAQALVSMDSESDKQVIGVRFAPGEARNYLPGAAGQIVSQQIPLAFYFGDSDEIAAQVLEEDALAKRIALIKNYLTRHYLFLEGKQRLIQYCVNEIINAGGNIKIHDLAINTGYTSSYIVRLFYEFIGLLPKQFAEVVHPTTRP
ncbi:MAG: hypothetical protein LBQ16_01810 [Gracilibacteraceae bacterium]|nr:hypothetical protein [Gracilibacteraceae bacterium]